MYNYAKTLLALKSDTRGITALEYAVIGAVMAGLLVTGFTTFGGALTAALNAIKFS